MAALTPQTGLSTSADSSTNLQGGRHLSLMTRIVSPVGTETVGTAHRQPTVLGGQRLGDASVASGVDVPAASLPGWDIPWRVASCRPDPHLVRRLVALQKAVGEPVIASHATAANLHGFGVLADMVLHARTISGRALRVGPDVVLHRDEPRLPIVQRGLILVTDPAETAVDVARSALDSDVLAVLDAARHSGVTLEALTGALDLARGSREIAGVRRWLDHADPRAESADQSRMRWQIVNADLPSPDLQVLVAIAPGGFRRIQLGWRRRRIGLDYDGGGFFTPAGSLARDRHRHRQLLHAGWTMLYATHAHLHRNPAPLLARLRHLLS